MAPNACIALRYARTTSRDRVKHFIAHYYCMCIIIFCKQGCYKSDFKLVPWSAWSVERSSVLCRACRGK